MEGEHPASRPSATSPEKEVSYEIYSQGTNLVGSGLSFCKVTGVAALLEAHSSLIDERLILAHAFNFSDWATSIGIRQATLSTCYQGTSVGGGDAGHGKTNVGTHSGGGRAHRTWKPVQRG
jgi:hypothetical protein